jgi:hypothetical protein
MRVPTRFIFPATVGLAILTFIPLGWIFQRLRGRRPLLVNLCLGLFFLMLLAESWNRPIMLKTVCRKGQLPKAVRKLARQPPAPVFIWPTDYKENYDYLYLYYNSYFWFPMVNGRSGYLPREQGRLLDRLMAKFPASPAIELLQRNKVHYLLICGELMKDKATRDALRRKLDALGVQSILRLIYSDSSDSLWEIASSSRPHG